MRYSLRPPSPNDKGSVAGDSENGMRERVHVFGRDPELMEVIAAAEDAVVNACVDLEDAEEDRLARAFSS